LYILLTFGVTIQRGHRCYSLFGGRGRIGVVQDENETALQRL